MSTINSAEGGAPVPRGVVVRAKTEYLGDTEQDLEETTQQEQAAWWLALKLRPGASLLVCSSIAFAIKVWCMSGHEVQQQQRQHLGPCKGISSTIAASCTFVACAVPWAGMLLHEDESRCTCL